MHGVPKELPLGRFVGDWLTQICIGQNEVILHFSEAGSITVQGGWELADFTGRLVDRSMEHAVRDAYRLHLLLGSPLEAFSVMAPEWFSLAFASGFNLKIFDDSSSYESFSVEPTGSAGVYI